MAKLLDNRGTTSNIFQIGSENAVKSADNALEVVSAQFPAERRDFRANTATFEGLVLPNALLNATDNRFTKNPISNGYELVYGDKRITVTVDQATGEVVVRDESAGTLGKLKADTGTFTNLNLPNATLNAENNTFTKNPVSKGYVLSDEGKNSTLSIDQDTGMVESSSGLGIKNSGYVSNCILGFKAPASVSGMTITMPAGFNINYSDGRDLYDETNNPTGIGALKSYNSITDAAYTVTVAPTGEDETVSFYALYDDTAKELFYVSKDQLYYGIKVPTAEDGYIVRRDSNLNEYYRLVDGAWVKRHIMRVASFDLTDGKTLDNFEPCYPCDLLKLTDYLVADSGGSGGGSQQGVVRSMEIPASSQETTSIALDYACNDKNAMLVLVEHTVVPPSTYNISANGKTLTFSSAVPAGMRIDLRWFSNIEVIKVDVPLASDTEFMQGTSEVLAPTVKQVHQYNGTKLPLFYPSRFPWVANNIEWLRSDTFSWQSGEVYTAAYTELLNIYNAEGGATASDTIGSETITYKRCANGMKVADATQQQAIMNVFVNTGSAFYFILDTENTRFKLPRTKYSLIGYEDGLGNYVAQEAASGSDVKVAGTQAYLYFYMGTYNQSAIDNTAGLNEELFNTKADADLGNLSEAGLSRIGQGLALMDVIFAPLGIDETKNKRRYLNGQVIIQSQFPAFTSAVKARMTTMANAFTTETNWQAEKTNSKLGQCGKFVVDDTAGTIRLPCVVNAQGLTDLAQIGGIKSESLPNITGATSLIKMAGKTSGATGAFTEGTHSTSVAIQSGSIDDWRTLYLNASLSSSTYQDNAPVQQEAIQYPYVIVVNTGVEEAERPINNYQVNNVYSYGMSQYYKGDMNNLSWLKSAGQWNSSTVYAGMYNWLVEQVNAGKSGFKSTTGYQFKGNTAETEGYTPSFATRNPVVGSVIYGGIPIKELGSVTQVNTDGSVVVQDVVHNIIVTLVFKQELPNLGWLTDYDFVINTTDQTFRLPLLNGQEGIFADGVKGNGLTLGLTNGTEEGCLILDRTDATGSFFQTGKPSSVGQPLGTTDLGTGSYTVDKTFGVTTDSSKSGIIVDKTVPSGYSLYYYVGDTLQNASLINIARIEEKLTDVNAASRGYLVESYRNGTEWYRVYSDGWIEQGGAVTGANAIVTITFPHVFTVVPTVMSTTTGQGNSSGNWYGYPIRNSITTTSFQAGSLTSEKTLWVAFGY